MTPAIDSIHCPACGQNNRPGRRFCAQCGVRFDRLCAACGERNEPDERFCGQCGTALEAGAPLPSPAGARSGTPPPPGPAAAVQTPTETPSSVANGRYHLERFLGEGAKKRVFLAQDNRLNRQVAIAIVKSDGLDATGLARVRREAEAMGRLGDHANVVTVFDVEEEHDHVFIVSRYVAGGDVQGHLHNAPDHRLPLSDALSIATDVARALQHAHEHDIVHRDVKPGNIWLTEDGRALLGDFGLAALSDLPRLTQEGTMLGTVAYMPPEQALGRKADARSDLYSLGATLYEMVAGGPPFRGDDTVGVIAQHINSAPVRPSWHEKSIPRALDDLVLRLLAKDPDDRPATAGEVVEALAQIAQRLAEHPDAIQDSRSEETLEPATLGRFVGRERELGQLQDVFTRVLAGSGSVAMVVGEPGIGKTRLAKEFAVHAKLRGARVFTGPCYEGQGSVPYQPFVEAIHQDVHTREDDEVLRIELGEGAPELATLVPEIRKRFGDLSDPPPLDGEAERQRLFESMTAFLSRAAETAPVVLVLEDLHWADKPTLLLLLHLARRVRHDRVLLLGTYRDVELERGHPLAATIATLRSDGLYERVLLRGLSREGVRNLLRARSGHEVPDRFVERILEETEGNPFFVEEVVKHLAEIGAIRREDGQWVGDPSVVERSIPEGVREVIGHRLSRLSEPCNAMLTVAATMSGGFSFEILAEVCAEDEEALLDHLDEALRAQVIAERSDGGRATYEFSHALIRQTLYHELSTPRRVRLHRQVGEALERLTGLAAGPQLAELAHHFFQGAPGGDVDKAIATSMRAAEHARRLLAWEEAAAHTARALEALEMKADADEAQTFELLFSLGELQRLGGDRADSRQTLTRAAEIARRLSEPEWLGRSLLAYATEDATVQFDSPDVHELIEEGLRAIGSEDSELRVRLLTRLSIGLIFIPDPERQQHLSREAVEMARRLGDPRVLCRALIICAIVSPPAKDLETAAAISGEVMALADEAGHSELVLNARISHIASTLHTGDGEAFDREIQEYRRLADELRQPSMLWFAAIQRALVAVLRGPLDEATRQVDEALRVGQRGEHPLAEPFHTFQRGVIEQEQEPRGPATDALVTLWESPIGRAVHTGASSVGSLLRAGRRVEALEVFEATARQHFADINPDGAWLGRMVTAANACVELGDALRAAELYEMLRSRADFVALSGPVAICSGPVDQTLGRLAVLCGRPDDAVAHFEASIEKTQRLGFGVLLARFRLDFAQMLVERNAPGDRERALGLVTEALDGAEALGMKVAVEDALALKLRLQGAETSGVKQSIYLVADAVQSRRPDLVAHAAPDGTVTLLFSDMEGFTAMTERLGDLRAREVVRAHNRVVRESLAAHGGYEVELQGDGFLLAFGSARRGLLCAVAIQCAFAEYNAKHAELDPIRVRIGVHTGEALKDADKFFGRSVILAARIADQAQGEEILASNIVRELTASTGDVRFGAEREVELKGISSPQRLVRVEWRP